MASFVLGVDHIGGVLMFERLEDDQEIRKDLRQLHSTTIDQWIHKEQTRWTLLYVFLVASTVLILAWAAVFDSPLPGNVRHWAPIILSVSGIALCLIWIPVCQRENEFVAAYATLGEKLEDQLMGRVSEDTSLADDLRPPFDAVKYLRERPSPVRTRYLVSIIPSAFALIFAALLLLAITG